MCRHVFACQSVFVSIFFFLSVDFFRRLSSDLHQEVDDKMEQFLTENTDPSLRACLSLFSHTLQEGLVQTQQQLLSLDDQDIIMRPLVCYSQLDT